jgi:nucleotide-binding universal stress UspA family protein
MRLRSKKNILLCIEGPERCMDTVRNLSNFEPLKTSHIKLFHVFRGLPDFYWDIEKNPTGEKFLSYKFSYATDRRVRVENDMKKARDILVGAGYSKDSIQVKIHEYSKGIARDIIQEAKTGYDAIAFRRRATSRVKSAILGSVSSKIIESADFIPLLIIGRENIGRKILIATDRSEGALRAAEFVGSLAGSFDYDICLFNVIRAWKNKSLNAKDRAFYDDYLRFEKEKVAGVFSGVTNRLLNAGFAADQIKTKIVTGKKSRSAAIAKEADQGDYGIIALGRLGISEPSEFTIGSVPRKVLQLARSKSVWII